MRAGPIWDGVLRIGPAPATLGALAEALGGEVRGGAPAAAAEVARVAPIDRAGEGDLAPLLAPRFLAAAREARRRGARLIVDAAIAARACAAGEPRDPCDPCEGAWVHAHAAWALAAVLDRCDVPEEPARWGFGTAVGAHVTLLPRVVIGRNVTIAPGAVIGAPGFGWASGPRGEVRRVPQLGGVIIEDDVDIGANCTIDAGTLGPTRIRRGAKIDAQCHVAHNCDVGEGAMMAAQCGLAGSVVVGAGARLGGQVGVADHVTIGAGARVAAKSGVIGDVPPGAVVAGYPAVARMRWLRALARTYRGLASPPPSTE